MQYTENYDLPITQGNDVIDYATQNEGFNKIDVAMKSIADDTATAVAEVTQLKTDIEHEMDEFTQNIEQEFEQTKEDISEEVNSALATAPKYLNLMCGTDTTENIDFGGQGGEKPFPFSTLNKSIDIDSDELKVVNNRLVCSMGSTTHTCVVNFNASFNCQSEMPITIALYKHYGASQDELLSEQVLSVKGDTVQQVNFNTIVNFRGNNPDQYYFITVRCGSAVTLYGEWNLSIASAYHN